MFDKMRRGKQQLSQDETERILRANTSGVLALIDGNGYPYTVPLSFVYSDGKIYFHSAKTGHKINAVRNCKKATFCVIDKDDVKPEKFTTFYKSAVAFGNVEIVENSEETLYAINLLGEKYYPDHSAELHAEIEKFKNAFLMIRFDIEHLTGKQCIELI